MLVCFASLGTLKVRFVCLGFGAMAWLLAAISVEAQVSAPVRPAPSYRNAVSGSVGYGVQLDRDADFWGVSADYARTLSDRWVVAASLTWDSETEVREGTSDRNIKSLTLAGIVSYALTPWMMIASGLGKGFADTDNPAMAMRFASGDLGTGVALGFAPRGLPLFLARDSVGFSIVYEYNLSKRETSLSFDVSYVWSF